jgi:hypothetical protein
MIEIRSIQGQPPSERPAVAVQRKPMEQISSHTQEFPPRAARPRTQ